MIGIRNQITSPISALSFVTAGNSTFTLVSCVTGNRFTYKVKQPEAGSDIKFVGLLSGPGNESDYSYMGLLVNKDKENADSGYKLIPTKKSRVSCEAPSWKAFSWLINHLNNGELSDKCEFWHEGRCGRCGRKLTVPESIEIGLGPICADL